MLGWRYKDPDDVLDYTVDWSTWLGADTIVSATWAVPAGITQDSVAATTTTTTIWLSGGTSGTNYTIGVRIVTTDGRTKDESFTIRMRQS